MDRKYPVKRLKRTAPLSKFQRYRRAQRRRGMKLLRVWVPDPHSRGFKKELERQCKLLRGSKDEIEVMRFIGAIADWPKE